MKLQLESTDKIISMNGVPCRAWQGATESGIPVIAFIVRVAIPEDLPAEVHERFASELIECRKPTPDLAGNPCWDARLIL